MLLAFVLAQTLLNPVIDVPDDVANHVPRGHAPIALAVADLNGDGVDDAVLVTESIEEVEDEHPRALLVLVRSRDGVLRVAARSDKAVYCRECGGMMGDPLASVEARKRELRVSHYGGSAWRWSNEYTFRYSRRDDAWQLVRVEERSFHASGPDGQEVTVYRPPRDFGKIDLRDFDPHDFLGKGPK